MRALSVVVLFIGLGTSYSGGQQAVSSGLPLLPDTQPARVKVYAVGPGVTAPELLPLNLPPIPSSKCKNKVNGKVVLSVLVDEKGRPRNIMFLKPLGSELDKFALRAVALTASTPEPTMARRS
jgi:outer membrane biosynthesis protein TonB